MENFEDVKSQSS